MKEIQYKSYYDSYIKSRETAKEKSLQRLKEGEINMSRIDSIKLMWFVRDFKILIAKYSVGIEISILKRDFLILLKDLKVVWKTKEVMLKDGKGNHLGVYILDPYIFMRWLLSLAILLDISDDKFKILTDLIKRDNIKDKLYDFLISSRLKDWKISDSMSLKKPENRIQEIIAIENKTECENSLKEYLNKEWYKTYKYFGFYNSHKKPENMFLFYGYWAFEVAALVKIKALDDSTFKANKYYPDRLV